MTDAALPIQGFFDGLTGGRLHGWAWRPDQPDTPVVIEITLNGRVLGEVEANQFRPDVREAGIGHGRYGFSMTFDAPIDLREAVRVVARVKDGPVLTDGEVEIGGPPPEADRRIPAFQAFVAAVLGQGGDKGLEGGGRGDADRAPRVNFIVHSAAGQEPAPALLGDEDDSYGLVVKAFVPLLEQLGAVHMVSDPAMDVDALHFEHLERGETSLFLSFAPPHLTVLGLRCPTVPVIAWAFPTIPSAVWDGERRHDWRWVLRQTGRAVTLSGLAARAVNAAMGADFPVVPIPAPLWDRRCEPFPMRPLDQAACVAIDGHVQDTRGQSFGIGMTYPPPPPATLLPAQTEVEGVVFTSVLAPRDGHKNWVDIISAFIAALSGARDATLVLKMVGADPNYWWWPFLDVLSRAPPFACRIVVLHGVLDDEGYAGLIQASHWVVNASSAERLALPLLEFMCVGRPAVAPRHTAMADYIDPTGALVVQSAEEPCSWPQDTRHELTTTRHRIVWSSLRDRLAEAYAITKHDRVRYDAMAQGAARAMKTFCSDEVVTAKLDAFLGLGHRRHPGAPASALIAPRPAP